MLTFFHQEKKKTEHFIAFYTSGKVLTQSSHFTNKSIAIRGCSNTLTSDLSELGIVIPKRNVKKSVCRNLLKRWIRELLKDANLLISVVIKTNKPIFLDTKQKKQRIYTELESLISSLKSKR